MDLAGVVDPHVFSATDFRPRSIDDLTAGRRALAAGAVGVLGAVAAHDRLHCTGLASAGEVMAIVPAAQALGVHRILVQHGEHSLVALSHAQQRTLALRGVYLERVAYHPLAGGSVGSNVSVNVAAIRAVGVERTALPSDLGQPVTPSWPEGLRAYIDAVAAAGRSPAATDVMGRRNPAALLGGC